MLAFGGKAAQYSVLARTADVPIQQGLRDPDLLLRPVHAAERLLRPRRRAPRRSRRSRPTPTVRDPKLAALRADMMDGARRRRASRRCSRPSSPKRLPGQQDALPHQHQQRGPRRLPLRRLLRVAHRRSRRLGRRAATPSARPGQHLAVPHLRGAQLLRRRPQLGGHGAARAPRTSPTRRPTASRSPPTPSTPRASTPPSTSTCSTAATPRWSHPPAGVTSDQFLYYFTQPNQPITYLAHSNLVPADTTVLTARQIVPARHGARRHPRALLRRLRPGGGNTGWYAMDVEFKFDNDEQRASPPSSVSSRRGPTRARPVMREATVTETFERYEFKYWVPLHRLESGMKLVRHVLQEDEVARREGASQINTSLYLDSPGASFPRAARVRLARSHQAARALLRRSPHRRHLLRDQAPPERGGDQAARGGADRAGAAGWCATPPRAAGAERRAAGVSVPRAAMPGPPASAGARVAPGLPRHGYRARRATHRRSDVAWQPVRSRPSSTRARGAGASSPAESRHLARWSR